MKVAHTDDLLLTDCHICKALPWQSEGCGRVESQDFLDECIHQGQLVPVAGLTNFVSQNIKDLLAEFALEKL